MKKPQRSIAIAASLFLILQPLQMGRAKADTLPAKTPVEDGTWDKSGKYTDLPENFAGYSADSQYGVQKSAIRFSLTDVAGNIKKATLRIHIKTKTDLNKSDAFDPFLSLYGSSVKDWNSWNTQNPNKVPLKDTDPLIVNKDFGIADNTWRDYDVTQYVKDQMSLDKIVTFVLRSEENIPGVMFEYDSKNSMTPAFYPQLVLETGPSDPVAPTVTSASTLEDTQSTTGLVITPNAADVGTVTHFKITAITGGTLYKNNGTTPINNGDFITVAEGAAGLKFTPAADANSQSGGTFTFQVQAALDNMGTGLSPAQTATITVNEVNDPPVAVDDSLSAIDEDSGARTIPFATLLANDSPGPANESGQTLTITSIGSAVGGTVALSGNNVIFTPTANYHGPASFQYTVTDNGTTVGLPDPKSATANVSFTINQVAHTPSVTNAVTDEDTLTTSGLVLTPNALDGAGVTHFKISAITGGTLYLNDGTTTIHNGDFITAAAGAAGLRFQPDADANSLAGGVFSFQAQASLDNAGRGISSATTATITVHEVNDPPVAVSDVLSAIYENSGARTIPFADLLANDSKGPANESGQTLTITAVDQAVGGTVEISGTNVIFTPATNYSGMASFRYTVTDNGTTNGTADPKSAQANVSFPINPIAHLPSVTHAQTAEDTQSVSGLVISANALDGAAATHYKITGITGGTLYKNNGTTVINNGDYITAAEGTAGLKFTPAANTNSPAGDTFSFQVQAALDNVGTGLSAAAQATITVTEVNDAPTAGDDVLSDMEEDTGARTISFAELLANDSAGPANESGQTLTITAVDNAVGGTVEISGTNVIFTPTANYSGVAGFRYTVTDNGTTNGVADPKSAQANVTFSISQVAHVPSVTTAQTAEDTQSTSGLVITRNAGDNSAITHFKITGITGGTLYKNDGTTQIQNGDYITVSEGTAGLKFTPAANTNSPAGDTFTFQVQAALDNVGTGLSAATQATITVTEVNDAPTAGDDVLSDVEEDTGARTISFAELLANDSAGPANESGQTLTITAVDNAVGGTVEISGTNVIFTPTANYSGVAGFRYTVTDNGTTNGVADPKSAQANVTFSITQMAHVPSVTTAQTAEDTQSTSGLVITRNAGDNSAITHFKITGITGGTLYKNDGTTQIQNGDFITVSEGTAGLKFTPAANANTLAGDTFTFQVQAALDNVGTGLSAATQATITVTEVNDAPTAGDDVLSSVEENSPARIIPFADLLANDTKGPANESGQTLTITAVDNVVGGTVEISGTNVVFTPAHNYRGTASFRYTVTDNGTTNGVADPKSAQATVSFTIAARADSPSVTNAATAEDTQTTSGLVITPTSNGGATTTHFKITQITGGQLYQNDGVTSIHNGDFITVAVGGAGLKFTPDADANGTTGFGFLVQAAPSTDGTLLSDAVQATITVSEVNDAPIATNDVLPVVAKGTAKVIIPFADLLANDLPGPANESDQTLTIISVDDAVGGTVSTVGGKVEFVLDPTFTGTAKFTYTVQDNGTTNGVNDFKTATAEVSFAVVDEDQPIITLQGDNTVYLLIGTDYVEPGYSAYDEADKDLTANVTVTGTVDTNHLGTYLLHYNVSDLSGNAAPEMIRTVHVVSNVLGSLTFDASAPIKPAFDPQTTDYKVEVPGNVSTLTISANAFDPTATLTINGEAKGNGGSKTISLKEGKNEITFVVTAKGGTTKTYTLEVTRLPIPVTPPSGGGGSGTTKRPAKVVTGPNGDEHVVPVEITRTQQSDGKVIDSVAIDSSIADTVVKQAQQDGSKTARIIIDDLPEQPADEVKLNIARDVVNKWTAASLSLSVEMSGVRISLSLESLRELSASGQDLYFHVVPLRQPDVKKDAEQTAIDSKELKDYAHGQNVRPVGLPMTIDTNYINHKTKVMFPLLGVELPKDPKQRQAFLNSLAVFVDHGAGEKLVEKGTLIYDAVGNPLGIEIEVDKFSTFTIVAVDEAKLYPHYVSGYPDGTFHPESAMTRAELASILDRLLGEELSHTGTAQPYPDVAPSHWAAEAIQHLRAAGILVGDPTGTFRPESSITRAEMAVLVAKLKGLNLAGASDRFQDTQGHWASAAIAAVQQAGLMVGFGDNTFHPDQILTRAEAISVLNRLFDRPMLQDVQQGTWPDVSSTHWAYADIESASNDIRKYSDGHTEKADAKKADGANH